MSHAECGKVTVVLTHSTTVVDHSVPATATLSADFVRPAMPPLTFEAQVDRAGRTVAFITVNVLAADDRLATKVSGTMSVDGIPQMTRSAGLDGQTPAYARITALRSRRSA